MLPPGNGGSAPAHALGHVTYERHRPEHTLPYRLIEEPYPTLVEQLDPQGRSLPTHAHRELEAHLTVRSPSNTGSFACAALPVICERLVMPGAILYLATCQSRVNKILVILRMLLLFF